MKIETPRLIIRPFQEKDADALYRIKTDPRVMEYCPDFLDVDAKREDMPDYIRTFRKLEEDGDFDTWRCYAIENKVTGEVMGAITFCKQNMLHEYDMAIGTVCIPIQFGYRYRGCQKTAQTGDLSKVNQCITTVAKAALTPATVVLLFLFI